MSVFRSRPALRWLVPSAAAVVIIGGGAAAGTIVASADPALPDRSAAQLLVDVQTAKVDGFSGTVVESADLGLPAIASALGGSSASSTGDLTDLIAGSHTARVWYAGPDQTRLALVGTNGETDVIHSGTDVWLWKSSGNTATHLKLPADQAGKAAPSAAVPTDPQQAAAQALAAIDPTTKVTTTGAAKVAGRNAYELVLSPKDTASLIGEVRLAIDAQTHIPLRVEVYAKNATSPAIRVAFQQISFTTPDAQQFRFNPPPGAKVTTEDHSSVDRMAPTGSAKADKVQAGKAKAEAGKATGNEPTVIGKGWTSIVELKLPADSAKNSTATKGSGQPDAAQMQAALGMLPAVSGSWGSGHVLSGSLFSALITSDNRVFIGAVTPAALEQAAAK